MNEKQKSGLILGLIGVALAVVAIRPNCWCAFTWLLSRW